MADVNIDNNNVNHHNPDHLAIDVDAVESGPEHTARAGGVTTAGDGFVSTTGAWALTTAHAGAVTTARAGSMAVNTAGVGSVTVSGGTGGGGVNTSGAGSVHTYTGVSAAKDTDVEEDCTKKLPWMVGVLGGLADGAAAAAALYKSPLGVAAHAGEIAYSIGLASVLVAGVVEIVAAFWVCRDAQKRGATGKKILYMSICTLLLAIGLVGAAIVLKK